MEKAREIFDFRLKDVKNKVKINEKQKASFKKYISSMAIDYINDGYLNWIDFAKQNKIKINEKLNNLIYALNELFVNFSCSSVYYTKDKRLYIDILEIKENIEYIIQKKAYQNENIKVLLDFLNMILSFIIKTKVKDIERKHNLIMLMMKKNKPVIAY